VLGAGEPRGEPEIGDLHLAGGRNDQDVRGLEISVNDASLMDVGDGVRNADGKLEEPADRHRRAEQPLERLSAGVFHDEGERPIVHLEREGPDDGSHVEHLARLVLPLEPGEVLRPAAPRVEHLEDHRAAVGVSNSAVHGGTAALVNGLADRVGKGRKRARHEGAG
jgi:hypothetical protein